VQSLSRALSLLNRIAGSPNGGVTLTKLARQVGLPVSTAHRLLITLEQERYVRFNNDDRHWSIGVQAFIAGSGFIKTRSLVALARSHIRQLMENCGETVNLAVEEDGKAVFLAQAESRQSMEARSGPGTTAPMHCSAAGKAIFSAMSDTALAHVLCEHGMPRLTGKTITSLPALRNELATIRKRGYAVDDEEHVVGVRCIASPVFDETVEVVAAVSVTGAMSRIERERVPQLGQMVVRAAGIISVELGVNR
jgi:IclR family transcriptional regulator, acetate operon repressor